MGINYDDASDIYGYTPPCLYHQSLSNIFHDPADNAQNCRTAVAVKPRSECPQSPHKDSLLERLADMLVVCAEKNGCLQCSNQHRCNKFWNKVSEYGCHRHLTEEKFGEYKGEWEGRVKPK